MDISKKISDGRKTIDMFDAALWVVHRRGNWHK